MSVMTNESLYEIKTVSEPVVHQDQVFFVETLVDEEENNYQKTIYSVNQKTGRRCIGVMVARAIHRWRCRRMPSGCLICRLIRTIISRNCSLFRCQGVRRSN